MSVRFGLCCYRVLLDGCVDKMEFDEDEDEEEKVVPTPLLLLLLM